MIYGIDDSYNNLFLRSNFVLIHQTHLRFLVTEIFKSISKINPEFIWSFFKKKRLSYNLREGPILNVLRTYSTYYRTNAALFQGSLVWNNLWNNLAEVKSSDSVFEFKTKVKIPGNIERGCLICRLISFTTVFSLLPVLFYIYYLLEFISFSCFYIPTVNKDLNK